MPEAANSEPIHSFTPSTLTDGKPLPRLIVFDLDYTLWPFWVDIHVTPPLQPTGKYNLVKDRCGDTWDFYPHVPVILSALRERGIKVAAASRTHTPDLAREMLSLLALDPAHTGGVKGARGIDYFDEMEIYPGEKITHFRSLKRKARVDYKDMLFFDDESRNRNVEQALGVRMILVPKGVSKGVFDRGVQEWRKQNGHA